MINTNRNTLEDPSGDFTYLNNHYYTTNNDNSNNAGSQIDLFMLSENDDLKEVKSS